MDEKKNSLGKDENAMTDAQMDLVAGGIYTRPGQCSCYDPITEGVITKCRNCGRVYSQQVP